MRAMKGLFRSSRAVMSSGSRSLATNAPRTSRSRRPYAGLAAGVGLATAAYTAGSVYPPTIVQLMYPRPAPPSPSGQSIEGVEHIHDIEEQLQTLPLVVSLRSQKDEYYEARPYESYPEEKRIHSLTAGTLSGPGKFATRPLIFAKWDESESVVVVHVGRSLCGHDGIVHGGLLATLLDETLARNAFFNLPSKIGVTANLSINYKAPTKADQYIIVRTKVDEVKGRKAIVSGRIEDLEGTLLVEAKGTFVEPKYAKMLNLEGITKAMGARPEPGHPVVGVDVAVTS